MKKLTTEEFIEKAKLIHGDTYDYSFVEYINNKTKVNIICHEHGIFQQQPNNHITNKQRCPKCSELILNEFNKSKSSNINEFITKSRLIHGDTYDYSLVNYINKKTKVKIICSKHGVFEQQPKHHLIKSGCPKCRKSKGELLIENILKINNIKYETQKTFDKCKLTNKLPFDFYLPNHNICIEYDGEQHFKPIKVFGGEKRFIKQLETDRIKNNFCLEENINLFRIKYSDDITILTNKLINNL